VTIAEPCFSFTIYRTRSRLLMIPKIIHQTAPTKNLSWEERRMTSRMTSILKGWEYVFWDDSDNDRLVAQYFPQFIERYRQIKRGVVRADLARCMYLYVHGGFYFDTDYKILAPIGDDILAKNCVLPISRGSTNEMSSVRLGNAVMGSAPRHPFWHDFLDDLFSSGSLGNLTEDRIEKTTGPEGLTRFFFQNHHNYADVFLPAREIFHPQLTAANFSYEMSDKTIDAHLCWGSWRTKQIPRLARNICTRKITAL
jgi:mannosyltransferase OCH1-like enzyme